MMEEVVHETSWYAFVSQETYYILLSSIAIHEYGTPYAITVAL
jgi:hypothetical protein